MTLVERLRTHDDDRLYFEADVLMCEAADRIEELERENESLRRELYQKQVEIERLKASQYGLYEIEAELEKLRLGIQNCRIFAAQNRKEDWALLILGFCAEAGVTGSITR
ncbi:MAG: hypothetical protein ACR2IJ_03545 [Fluviibacter sp.]